MDGRCPPTREPVNYNNPSYNSMVMTGLQSGLNGTKVAKAISRDTFAYFETKLAGLAVSHTFSILS